MYLISCEILEIEKEVGFDISGPESKWMCTRHKDANRWDDVRIRSAGGSLEFQELLLCVSLWLKTLSLVCLSVFPSSFSSPHSPPWSPALTLPLLHDSLNLPNKTFHEVWRKSVPVCVRARPRVYTRTFVFMPSTGCVWHNRQPVCQEHFNLSLDFVCLWFTALQEFYTLYQIAPASIQLYLLIIYYLMVIMAIKQVYS